MKPYTCNDQVVLSDAKGIELGVIDIDSADSGLLLGRFHPSPAFAQFAELFHRFEEYVDAAALAVLPEIERQIAALDLRIGRASETSVSATDVQIYSDGGFSCRLIVPTTANGQHPTRSSTTA